MVISETLEARTTMRLAIGIIVLAAVILAVELWTSGATRGWFSTGVLLGAGLTVIVVAWVVVVMLRNRQHSRSMDTRDSALW